MADSVTEFNAWGPVLELPPRPGAQWMPITSISIAVEFTEVTVTAFPGIGVGEYIYTTVTRTVSFTGSASVRKLKGSDGDLAAGEFQILGGPAHPNHTLGATVLAIIPDPGVVGTRVTVAEFIDYSGMTPVVSSTTTTEDVDDVGDVSVGGHRVEEAEGPDWATYGTGTSRKAKWTAYPFSDELSDVWGGLWDGGVVVLENDIHTGGGVGADSFEMVGTTTITLDT